MARAPFRERCHLPARNRRLQAEQQGRGRRFASAGNRDIRMAGCVERGRE